MVSSFPCTEKQLKSRISSYNSAMRREKKDYNFISDGGGKRYLLFSLYFVLNDLDKSKKYFDWYEKEFSDDIGEPIQKLCWALSLYRMKMVKEAKQKLADLMFSNLYLIPMILGEEVSEYDIWHNISYKDIDYAKYISEEVIKNITESEFNWLRFLYHSFEFTRVRKAYVDIYKELKITHDASKRKLLFRKADSLLDEVGNLDE
jgi:hypothetical protein